MLSYRHAFHAGNHADVLKHLTLCLLLRRLTEKDKPCFYLDTHAACGIFALGSRFAALNQEYQTGLAQIWDNAALRALVPEYYAVINKLNAAQNWRARVGQVPPYYPGSPYFAATLTRPCDRLTFLELHSNEFAALRQNFKHDERIYCELGDGFAAVGKMLPPPIRRGLIFMDPSYEMKSDYLTAIKAVKTCLTRFNTGMIALWYPVLGRMQDRSRNLVQEIKRLRAPLLQVELRPLAQEEEHGMCGSGMLIVNYPYQLYENLESCLNILYPSLCGKEGGAKLRILNEKA